MTARSSPPLTLRFLPLIRDLKWFIWDILTPCDRYACARAQMHVCCIRIDHKLAAMYAFEGQEYANWYVKLGCEDPHAIVVAACAGGQLDLVRAMSYVQIIPACAYAAARNGHAHVLEYTYLHSRQYVPGMRIYKDKKLIKHAVCGPRASIDVLEWMMKDTFPESKLFMAEHMMNYAVIAGRMDICDWLLDVWPHLHRPRRAIESAARMGKLDIVKKLYDGVINAFPHACIGGHIETIAWLHAQGCDTSYVPMDISQDVIAWLSERGITTSSATHISAASAGLIHQSLFLMERGFQPKRGLYIHAIKGNQSVYVHWLYDQGIDMISIEDALECAMQNNSFAAFEEFLACETATLDTDSEKDVSVTLYKMVHAREDAKTWHNIFARWGLYHPKNAIDPTHQPMRLGNMLRRIE